MFDEAGCVGSLPAVMLAIINALEPMRLKTFSESKNYMHKLKILYSKRKLDKLLKQKKKRKRDCLKQFWKPNCSEL
jgi:hypothetical protein